MASLKIGILGASKIAPMALIAPAKANNSVSLHGIAARDPARAKAFAVTHGIAHAHDSYAALIADPAIDLVYNSLPPKHHLEWTLAALRGGKHVLLEKPSGMNAAEARTMADAARKAGRRLIEAFHYRYHPLFARVLDIARMELGALQSAEALFEVPIANKPDEIRYDAGLGGGALMDLGCYPIQWLRNVAGGEPDVLEAFQTREAGGADIATTARMRFPNRLHATLSCSMQPASGRPMASLTVRGAKGEMTVLNPLAPQFGHLLTWKRTGEPERQETFPQRPTYDYQLDAVVDAIANGTAVPTEGDDIVNTMRVIDAVKSAAQKG
jgi:predicted dehydrogenase